jgi:sialic acid synthase SpsE/protoporphyrinogen oxidase
MKKKKIIILGAGPVGLISGWLLSKKKWDVKIYEMQDVVGGMCRSWKWNGHILDTGPHIFHTYDESLIKFWKKNFSKFLEEGTYYAKNVLNDRIEDAYSYPISKEAINKYPNQIKNKIKKELNNKNSNFHAKNFKEFIEQQVGKTLTEMFFEGYPEKVWGISTEKMTADWAPKRIKITEKIEPFFQKQYTAVSKYGTGSFYNSIATKIKKNKGKIYLNNKITNIKHIENKITQIEISNKNKIKISEDDIILSTLPITLTSRLLGYNSNLTFRGIRSVYVSLNKKRSMPKNINWLYFPSKDIIFNRVSETSTMTKTVCKKDKTYLTCEITFSKNDYIDKLNFNQVSDKVIKGLLKTNLIKDRSEIDLISENKENFVYPVQFTNYKSELAKTKQQVEKFGQLYSLGTGGEFEYADSQILFHKSMDLVEILEQKNDDDLKMKKTIISNTLNSKVKLGSKLVGDGEKPFIIAEAGLNHNGDLNLAKQLIDEAKKTFCDAIKFQTFSASSRVSKKVKSIKYSEKADGLREDIHEMFSRLELSYSDFKEIFKYARKKRIEIFSTPFSSNDVDFLEKLNVSFYKIASVDCVNLPLIEKIGLTKKPLILSTGMSDMGIVDDAVEVFKKTGNKNLILLHCLSSYPADEKEMNLKAIQTLKNIYNIPVGLSDHYTGLEMSILALGSGANIIERHFTVNKQLEGPDHNLSSEPDDMKKICQLAINLNKILGDGQKKIQPSEYLVINSQRKCLYAYRDIKKGEMLNKKNITIKGPAGGILPKYLNIVLGRRAKFNIEVDEPITWETI